MLVLFAVAFCTNLFSVILVTIHDVIVPPLLKPTLVSAISSPGVPLLVIRVVYTELLLLGLLHIHYLMERVRLFASLFLSVASTLLFRVNDLSLLISFHH